MTGRKMTALALAVCLAAGAAFSAYGEDEEKIDVYKRQVPHNSDRSLRTESGGEPEPPRLLFRLSVSCSGKRAGETEQGEKF